MDHCHVVRNDGTFCFVIKVIVGSVAFAVFAFHLSRERNRARASKNVSVLTVLTAGGSAGAQAGTKPLYARQRCLAHSVLVLNMQGVHVCVVVVCQTAL